MRIVGIFMPAANDLSMVGHNPENTHGIFIGNKKYAGM